jgi:hypothetical protein
MWTKTLVEGKQILFQKISWERNIHTQLFRHGVLACIGRRPVLRETCMLYLNSASIIGNFWNETGKRWKAWGWRGTAGTMAMVSRFLPPASPLASSNRCLTPTACLSPASTAPPEVLRYQVSSAFRYTPISPQSPHNLSLSLSFSQRFSPECAARAFRERIRCWNPRVVNVEAGEIWFRIWAAKLLNAGGNVAGALHNST